MESQISKLIDLADDLGLAVDIFSDGTGGEIWFNLTKHVSFNELLKKKEPENYLISGALKYKRYR